MNCYASLFGLDWWATCLRPVSGLVSVSGYGIWMNARNNNDMMIQNLSSFGSEYKATIYQHERFMGLRIRIPRDISQKNNSWLW